MLDANSERRKFTRIHFDTGITLCQNGAVYHTYLIDISLKGILVQTPSEYTLKSDIPVDTSIILGDETEIQMTVELIHSSDKHLGFKCISIDMESIGHLRRLVELNIDCDHASERVLNELIEQHAK